MSSFLRKLISCCGVKQELAKDGIEMQDYTSPEEVKAHSANGAAAPVVSSSAHTAQFQPAPSDHHHSQLDLNHATTSDQQPSVTILEARRSQLYGRLPEWPPPSWLKPTADRTEADPDEISPVEPRSRLHTDVRQVLAERRKTLDRLRRPPVEASPAANGQPLSHPATAELPTANGR